MGYEPIRVIATSATSDGHVNRETTFDENPLSNKICYRDGLPYMTATPKSLGGKGPRRVDLNGIFYLFSSNLYELQQGNYPTYNAAVVGTGKPLPDGYPLGAVLWYPTGGYFVRSLVADNTESDLTNTTKWAKITISAADLAAAETTMNAAKANIGMDNITRAGVNKIFNSCCLDSASAYALTNSQYVDVPFVSAVPGYIWFFTGGSSHSDSRVNLYIDGVEFNLGLMAYVGNYRHTYVSATLVPIMPGQQFQVAVSGNAVYSATFIPLKGA